MSKIFVKTIGAAGLIGVNLFGAGYKIPEQSHSSVAMSGASVASSESADAAYYNPANMSWMEDTNLAEIGLTYIHLPSVKYDDSRSPAYSGESKKEDFYIPTIMYVSPKMGDFRFGLSFTAPGGLSKRWDTSYQKTFAEEFTLKILELNPTISYSITPEVSFGLGARAVYTEGVVKSSGIVATTPMTISASREMTGDSLDYGYNLALAYKPTQNTNLSITYRSKVDLSVEGDAKLTSSLGGSYKGDAGVEIPLPAALSIAGAYTFNNTTIEALYEKTYWSAYQNLDFTYPQTFATDPAGVMKSAFDDPKQRNWENSNSYRLGLKHKINNTWDVMLGFAIDKTPAPQNTVGFELPDSDAKLYSIGTSYKLDNDTTIGFAYLYDDKEARTVVNSGGVSGTFSDGGAHLGRFSMVQKF